MKDKNVFYVYEWFNVETKEVFYVGKGKNGRYKNIKQRNNYFKNYHNKYKCDVRKIKEQMTEQDAFDLEIELIAKYKKIDQCKCNITDGGEGTTYEEGTWNHLFRSLQFSHDIRHGTAEMYNEEDYDSDNLKNRTTKELQKMYDDYNEFSDNEQCNLDFEENTGVKIQEPLNTFELEMKNGEIKMLTDMFAYNISKENPKYKGYNKIKKEYEFYSTDVNWDDFLDEIIKVGGFDYMVELTKTVNYNFRYLKYMSNFPNSEFSYMIISYNLKEDGFVHLRLQHSDNSKHFRVKIDIKDILMGILMQFKELRLYEILHREILVAPIYK